MRKISVCILLTNFRLFYSHSHVGNQLKKRGEKLLEIIEQAKRPDKKGKAENEQEKKIGAKRVQQTFIWAGLQREAE